MLEQSMFSILRNVTAIALMAASHPLAAAEPGLEFEALLNTPGVVGQEWLVRDWVDVSGPPKWPVTWEVDADGVLYGTGRYAPGNSGDRWIGTWLMSRKEYGDFVLELEFKFRNGGASGNGGVALRAPLHGDPAYDGLEVQITDSRFERSYFPDAGLDQLTGALYFVSPAKEDAYLPGEWNRYRIEMRGPIAKVELNGRIVQDVDLTTLTRPAKKHGVGTEILAADPGAKRPRQGHIGFQDLSESGEVLMFRNIRIAEIR
jgi:hypothetical protein